MRFVAWLLALALLVVVPSVPAQADTGCIINVVGIKVCGELLEPLPTITIKPDPIVVPGPTETVTIRPPQPTQTVEVPVPGPNETVTVEPPTVTKSALPEPQPTATITEQETVTASPDATPRQEGGSDDTMEDDTDSGFFRPDVDLGDDEVTAGEVGIGTLTLLALVGLLLLAMYGGYVLGYKDREKNEADFMRALLDGAKSRRGQHS